MAMALLRSDNMRVTIVCALALFALACTKSKAPEKAEKQAKPAVEKKAAAPKAAAEKPKAAPAAAAADAVKDDGKVVTVALTGNDQMKYNLSEIKVKAGRTIKLTLTHVGKMPGAAMGHNFILLKAGTDVAGFATKAVSAAATGYVPASEKASVLAQTKVVGGGESASIEFPAPAVGTYDYICSFPGHYAVMRGKLIVQ
jgi:azurin